MKIGGKKIVATTILGLMLFGTLSSGVYAHNGRRGSGEWMNQNYDNGRHLNGYYHDSNWSNSRMHMNSWGDGNCSYYGEAYGSNIEQDQEKISFADMKSNVEDYIDKYKGDMKIQNILKFPDNQYLFLIKDETKYAMELVVNQYTGNVYLAMGASHMWNTEYGNRNFVFSGDTFEVAEAIEKAQSYLENNKLKYTLEESAMDFYGYYKFFVKDGKRTVGFIDVNQYNLDIRSFILNSGEIEYE